MNPHTTKTVTEQDDLSICPSFSCYSSDRLSETAIKVASEHKNNNNSDDEDEFEFEFEFSAEDLFTNDQIGPVFPVFNRNIDQFSTESNNPVPLSQLFLEDREEYDQPSCSSSDADESENIPASSYSIWRPKPIIETTPPSTSSRCNKSKSTGSVSKRWKFRDLLLRSNSEGKDKDNFVFLAPKQKKISEKKGKTVNAQSPHEALYVRNRAATEGNKKKSYLPYRKDLVGFFANVNGLRKSFPHF